MPTLTEWPFDQPSNCAVFTIRQILEGAEPILHVTHDLDDEGWQFLGRGDAKVEDCKIVGLGEMVSKDASLYKLADMPPGWHAWRKSVNEPWIKAVDPSNYEKSVYV
jgi:hypothetical protein